MRKKYKLFQIMCASKAKKRERKGDFSMERINRENLFIDIKKLQRSANHKSYNRN